MSKGKARTTQLKGKLKETFGKATGDKSMKREGRGEMLSGKAHELAEKAAEQVRKRTRHH
ncbi:CsbD family protein [Streptomyces sp. NPDC000410]|uniref:CsbD family protein n=1 Tax=Streptomyces sp. NPDC000410 TaxID=3154254 RepID=UPI00332437DC